MSVGACAEKFKIVSRYDHGHTQKYDLHWQLESKTLCICKFCLSPLGIRVKKKIARLMQYTVFEIQFWFVNCTTVIVGYAKISSNIPFLSYSSDASDYNG